MKPWPALKLFFLALSVLALIVATSYFLPRTLSQLIGESSPWISWLYTYILGFIFFVLSLVWIFTRKGINPKRRKQEFYWLLVFTTGLVLMFVIHGLWILMAIQYPIKT